MVQMGSIMLARAQTIVIVDCGVDRINHDNKYSCTAVQDDIDWC